MYCTVRTDIRDSKNNVARIRELIGKLEYCMYRGGPVWSPLWFYSYQYPETIIDGMRLKEWPLPRWGWIFCASRQHMLVQK